jgi:DNA polymerase III epsilon subunit family exonuclease
MTQKRQPPQGDGSSHSSGSSGGSQSHQADHQQGQGGRGRRRKGQRRGGRRRELDPALPTSAETVERLHSALGEGRYIVFDIETTGGNPEKNGITEIFAIRYVGGEIEGTFYSMVNPGIPIPPIVRRMTGINNAMVKNAPRIDEVMPGFVEFVGGDVFVSHNTIGDMKFIRYFAKEGAGVALDNFYLCTHLLVEKLVPEAPDKSLKGLAEHFKLGTGELHRAEADAYVTLDLFKVLLEKLGRRNVRRIDEAVRLQGDMESAMRLGWGVKPEAFEAIPQGPGVFRLFDHDGKLLFLSSAPHLDREVQKLLQFGQLPRQLLRLVLRSYDIKGTRSPNAFAAMLEECDALGAESLAFHPVAWHQRQIQALFLAEHPEGLRIGIGALEEGTRHAFGPVRDRRVAGEMVEELARALDRKVGRDGLVVPMELESDLIAFFSGRLEGELAAVDKRRRSVKLWFRPAERRALAQRAKIMKSMLSFSRQLRLAPLLERTGLLLVPDKQGGTWQVHSIIGSRPRHVTTVRGEPDQKLRQGGLGTGLAEQLAAERATLAGQALGPEEAQRVNATLWWLFNGRGDSRFLPLAELDFSQPAPVAPARRDGTGVSAPAPQPDP